MGQLHRVRKLVQVEVENCKGHTLLCSFGKPGGEIIEKKEQRAHYIDGVALADFSVGGAFSGQVHCHFDGSGGGSDDFTVTVP